jgi:hypothetical protein
MTIDLRKPQHTNRPHTVRVPDVHAYADVQHDVPRARVAPKRKQERAVMTLAAIVIGLIVLLIAGYGVSKAWGYFFGGTDAEVRALVSDVGEHMLLPDDETPTLATVSDMHALEGQAFFRNAKEGDKVLMYLRSQRAIIYRPSIDKIIEVGPITGSEQ